MRNLNRMENKKHKAGIGIAQKHNQYEAGSRHYEIEKTFRKRINGRREF